MTFQLGDKVERNPAAVSSSQIAEWHRQYPGGRRGVVIGIDDQFAARPYLVRWDDNHDEFHCRDADLLPATVPAAQASLFEVTA